MFTALAVLVLAAVARIAYTTPTTSTVKPSAFDVTTAAGFPVHTLDITRDVAVGTHEGAIESRSADANPAILLLCPTTNCATCSGFNLSTFPVNECFLTNVNALSVAISQPAGGGLPFEVAVGTANCASLAVIPAINECFNVNGGPFTNFALLE